MRSINASTNPRTYRLTPHEHVTVLRATPELLEAEAYYAPGGQAPVMHRHPRQFERFAVLEGQLEITIDGETRVLHPGDTATVGRGRAHAMAAAGEDGARVIWQTSPALQTEAWWQGLDALGAAFDGQPPLPATARLLRRHHAEFQLALPAPLDRLAVLFLALLPVRQPRGAADNPAPSPRTTEAMR